MPTMLTLVITALLTLIAMPSGAQQKKGAMDLSMEKQGMTDVQSLDSSIFVSLMYTRPDNFTGVVLYTDMHRAYLHPLAAKALVKAQKRLKQLRPDLSLKIYDAVRPIRIQQKMWDKVKNTPKYFYVSNPAKGGGLHNYGMAVDITLCTLNGDSIPMGALVDHMGRESHITAEDKLVENGVISKEERSNRQLLRDVMKYAGFRPLSTEWWHFNFMTRATARKYYKVIK